MAFIVVFDYYKYFWHEFAPVGKSVVDRSV
jgi:hypothetical protein